MVFPEDPDFQKSLPFTLVWEGGNMLSRDPNDKGGLTRFGIALSMHPELTENDVVNMTQETATQIYFKKYWLQCGCDVLSWPLCQVIFDTAVNAGPGAAKTFLERAVGKTENDKARNIITQRVFFYQEVAKKNPKKRIYLKGWMARVTALKNECGFA